MVSEVDAYEDAVGVDAPHGLAPAPSGPVRDGDLSIETRGIEPVPVTARYGRPAKLGTLWFGTQMCASQFLVGALGPAFGLSFWQSFWIIIIGNLTGALSQGYLCSWGPLTGLAQMEFSSAVFGRSVRLPAILNWITNLGWQGFNNIFGVIAAHLLLGIPLWIGVLACGVGQALLSILGYEAVHQFQRLVSMVMAPIFIILTWRILDGSGTTAVAATMKGPDLIGGIVLTYMAIMSNAFSWAPYASDYSRYLPATTRQRDSILWTFFGSAIPLIWIELLGLAVAAQVNSGGVSGATSVIQKLMGGSDILGMITLAAIYLSTIGCSSLDYYTGTLSLQTAGVHLSRPFVVVITAAVSFAISMWFLYGGAGLPAEAQSFLLFIGYWLGPWFGLIVVDWVRRRGNVDVTQLSNTRKLHRGIIPAIALAAGFIAALPFSNTTIGYNFTQAHPHSPLRFLLGWVSSNVLHGADLGFPVSCIVAVIIYIIADHSAYLRPHYMKASPDLTS